MFMYYRPLKINANMQHREAQYNDLATKCLKRYQLLFVAKFVINKKNTTTMQIDKVPKKPLLMYFSISIPILDSFMFFSGYSPQSKAELNNPAKQEPPSIVVFRTLQIYRKTSSVWIVLLTTIKNYNINIKLPRIKYARVMEILSCTLGSTCSFNITFIIIVNIFKNEELAMQCIVLPQELDVSENTGIYKNSVVQLVQLEQLNFENQSSDKETKKINNKGIYYRIYIYKNAFIRLYGLYLHLLSYIWIVNPYINASPQIPNQPKFITLINDSLVLSENILNNSCSQTCVSITLIMNYPPIVYIFEY
ncbi:Hypothetical_protein [Hexamita inflata]|uniref:Hypothetical_protein n=1 Tax=Hexamita inflata TaxID=28002 RepID=A0AA86Q3Y3_9EUKA|nr:Hypothetical protein HINF_LOCUS39455 [Hexamita inflata]